jgi:hypothetical protein
MPFTEAPCHSEVCMDKQRPISSHEATPPDSVPRKPETDEEVVDSTDEQPNPPRTTTKHWTSPKFGSAGSGGAELEPGPERD